MILYYMTVAQSLKCCATEHNMSFSPKRNEILCFWTREACLCLPQGKENGLLVTFGENMSARG